MIKREKGTWCNGVENPNNPNNPISAAELSFLECSPYIPHSAQPLLWHCCSFQGWAKTFQTCKWTFFSPLAELTLGIIFYFLPCPILNICQHHVLFFSIRKFFLTRQHRKKEGMLEMESSTVSTSASSTWVVFLLFEWPLWMQIPNFKGLDSGMLNIECLILVWLLLFQILTRKISLPFLHRCPGIGEAGRGSSPAL